MLLNAGAKTVISSIDGRLQSVKPSDRDECETALEALGQIGSSKYVSYYPLINICISLLQEN